MRTCLFRLTAALVALELSRAIALAQVTPPMLVPVSERAASIDGSCIPGASVQVSIDTGSGVIRLPQATCAAGSTFSVDVKAVPLLRTYHVLAAQTVGGASSGVLTVAVLPREGPFADEREDFESTAYLGLAIDTFGAEELNKYLNPEANGEVRERSIFGFDFAYRLLGKAKGSRQLWVYGETLHGTRSEDVDCAKAPELPSCKKELSDFATGLPTASLFLLRNATSLEAYVGVRVELGQVNLPGTHPAALYLNVQPGFLEVARSDGDAKSAHQVAVGARAIGGRMQGSYLEFGFGKSDLFIKNRNCRYKIDGVLQRELRGGFSLFAQLLADVDMGDGSDSIQSYFGLNFDVGTLFSQPAAARRVSAAPRRSASSRAAR